MERTQIYLTQAQTKELDERAREQGTTRSHLIREAIETYLGPEWDVEAFNAALDRFAGVWTDRDDINDIHEGMREAGRRKLKQLHPDYGSEADAANDHR